MEPAEVQHKVRTSLISNKNQWTPCDDIKPYPDLYFSTTFDLCSLEASPVSFWELYAHWNTLWLIKEVITIMVSSFILSKFSFLAVDLKKEPWKGCQKQQLSFWVLLAALSNCFFWKKSCTLCSDSSAITGTKNDHTGSWSSSWGVLCSRTLISETSGLRWKISNTVIWVHLEEDVRTTWRLEQDYKIVFKQPKWSCGELSNEKKCFHCAYYYFWCRSQRHRSWLPSRGGSLLLGRRPWRNPTVAALEYEVQLEILQPNNTRTGEIRSSQYFDPSWEPFCSRESYSSSENN